MSDKPHTPAFGSMTSAVIGIVLIAISLFMTVPVAINLPDSWPGAVLAVCVAGAGIALIVAHLKLGHRAMRKDQVNEGGRNAAQRNR